jgi:hypothetical protein
LLERDDGHGHVVDAFLGRDRLPGQLFRRPLHVAMVRQALAHEVDRLDPEEAARETRARAEKG